MSPPSSAQELPSRTSILTALITIQVLFASSYIFSKILMEIFPPMIWATLRSGVTAVLMGLVALLMRRPLPKFSSEFLFPLFAFSILGGILAQGLYLAGLHYTTSTNSAILYTIAPLVTLAVVMYMGHEEAKPIRFLGFLLAFIGVLVLSHVERYSFSNQAFFGDFLTLISCSGYGLFIALSKRFFQKYDRLWITVGMFAISTFGFLLLSRSDWSHFSWPPMTASLFSMMVFAIVGSTWMCHFLVVWAIAHAPSSRVALFDYLQPILVSAFGWFIFGEQLSSRTLVASLIIFIGVALTIEWKIIK